MSNENNFLFTPHHVWFLNVVSSLKNYILYIYKSNGENRFDIIINILSFFIEIIGTLIFNEMIIIRLFELDKGTKQGILKREKLDLVEMESSILEDDLRNEEEECEIKDS